MKSIPTFLSLQHHLSSIQDVCHKPLTNPLYKDNTLRPITFSSDTKKEGLQTAFL